MSRLLHRLTTLALLLIAFGAPLRAQTEEPTDPSATERSSTLGPVTAIVALSPAEPEFGDLLTLTLTVTAEPSVEVLMPSFGEALGSFSILEFAPRESIDAEQRTVYSQRYSLDVDHSGAWVIPPLVVEFVDGREGNRPAPEGDDAYELLTEAIEFTVKTILPENASAELLPPLGTLDPLPTAAEKARPFIFGGAILLVFVPLLIWILWMVRQRGLRRSAYDIALGRLRKLQRAPRATPEEIGAFYVELSAIVRRYLEDRFEIRAPESTTEEFLDRASRSQALGGDHRELLSRFLQQADLVKFARSIPGDLEIAESVRSAEQFLEDTREDAPMLEVAEGSAS